MALNNLGTRYSEVGRRQDALAPAEEAVQLRRDQARDNPAYLPDLAGALDNLGNRYSEIGRRQDALAPAEEAAQLYRDQARDNPAYLPDLAGALGNLGVFYSEIGRRQDALAPAEEAAQLYHDQARDNPAYLPDLAITLNNLRSSYSEVGRPESGEAAWGEVLAEASPADAAFLLASRAEAAEAGHPDAARWLAAGLQDASDDRGLAAMIHQQARRHRTAGQAAFDAAWERHTGQPVPGWLTVDTGLVATAEAWIGTETYEEEGAFLAGHPGLLDPSAEEAVSEALLSLGEEDARRYTALRQDAQKAGAEAAYRPLLLSVLASEFAAAGPAGQRTLLATRRDDLLDETVTETLDDLAGQEDTGAAAARRARALLDLARTGDAGLVLDALAEPARFPGLLQTLAARDDPAALAPAAVVAYTAAATDASAAAAIFYLAAGTAIAGDQDQARDLITQARDLDPDQATGWVNQLAGIGQHHPAVLLFIAALTAPPGPAANPSPGEAADDTD
jgi:predicted RNase H-like HicB family nuclease